MSGSIVDDNVFIFTCFKLEEKIVDDNVFIFTCFKLGDESFSLPSFNCSELFCCR